MSGKERGPSISVLSFLATAEVPLHCELRDQQRRLVVWNGHGRTQHSCCSFSPSLSAIAATTIVIYLIVTCAGPKAVKSN